MHVMSRSAERRRLDVCGAEGWQSVQVYANLENAAQSRICSPAQPSMPCWHSP
ncbi:Hypothetical protein A7982_11731 [Minicystis rosea]|nr:Hypothetical protein A7982_11731 [Minicystis rosea]